MTLNLLKQYLRTKQIKNLKNRSSGKVSILGNAHVDMSDFGLDVAEDNASMTSREPVKPIILFTDVKTLQLTHKKRNPIRQTQQTLHLNLQDGQYGGR